jgi:stage V sporulation protein B
MVRKGKSERKMLLKGAAVIAGGGLVAKVIGALYRIPLTNLIGGEGIGLYQLV